MGLLAQLGKQPLKTSASIFLTNARPVVHKVDKLELLMTENHHT